MKILITGASGFIGGHLLKTCLDRGHQVTACVRDADKLRKYYPGTQVIQCDFAKDKHISLWLARLAGIEVVINAVGIIQQRGINTFDALHTQTPSALFKACEILRIKQVIQISSLGADNSAFSQYHLSKKAADDFLSGLDLNWTIVMPSIVYGPGANSLRLFNAMAALPINPLVGNGSQQIQPIHINDLVKAVLTLVDNGTLLRRRIEAVGPEPVSLKQLMVLLKYWLGITHGRFLPIPYWLILIVARVSRLLVDTPVNTDVLKMLQKGNTGNMQSFVNTFGFTPASLKHALLQHPPLKGDYLDARLYFLLPLLKLTLALLWIATGLTSVFAFPVESSYIMLDQAGIPKPLASATLYAAAALDIGLGVALLISHHLRTVIFLQIAVILVYTALITVGLPQLWFHPFGPITKNIPLLVATLVLLAGDK